MKEHGEYKVFILEHKTKGYKYVGISNINVDSKVAFTSDIGTDKVINIGLIANSFSETYEELVITSGVNYKLAMMVYNEAFKLIPRSSNISFKYGYDVLSSEEIKTNITKKALINLACNNDGAICFNMIFNELLGLEGKQKRGIVELVDNHIATLGCFKKTGKARRFKNYGVQKEIVYIG